MKINSQFIERNKNKLLFALVLACLLALFIITVNILSSDDTDSDEIVIKDTSYEKSTFEEPDGTSIEPSLTEYDSEPDVPVDTQITDSTESGEPIVNQVRATLENMEIHDTRWAYFMVNRSNYVPDGYDDGIDFAQIQGYYVDARINEYTQAMINDAADDGVTLWICSAYRSYARQVTNFENRLREYAAYKYSFADAYDYTSGYIAIPGTSEHQTGLAIDFITPEYTSLDSGFENTAAYRWLRDNSYKYGFILRYPPSKSEQTGINYEPWHFRFIGFEKAESIYNSGLCLEEYMQSELDAGTELVFNELGALQVPEAPDWYIAYLNAPPPVHTTESDSTESDSTESDSTESDSVESDSVESDSTESDSVESDSVESDSTESDSTESDSVESDSTESDSVESDSTASDSEESDSTASDSVESDITESDSVESDSVESDSVESDSVESDSVESDSTESDSVESDSTESDSVESDSVESDSEESDSVESDSTESDSVESDSVESDSEETTVIPEEYETVTN